VRVRFYIDGENTLNGVLIAGLTYAPVSKLLGDLGIKFYFKPGEHEHSLYIAPPGDVLGGSINDVQLSGYFNLQEFACKGRGCGCYNAVKVDPELVRGLQAMRSEHGQPIEVTSAYRCRDHNRDVGGESNSYHTKGMAADIKSGDLAGLGELADKHFGDGGIGTYTWGYHVDLGPRRRW